MRKPLLLFATLLVAGIVTAFVTKNETPNVLAIGASAPMTEYKLANIDGQSTSLKQLHKENGLLVVFSCNTCPFVIGWEDRYPQLSEICSENKVGMVAVNSNQAKREGDDSLEEMKKHAHEKNYNFSYVVDQNSELANAFGATKTPQCFLFDKDLRLVYTGAIDDNMDDASKVKHRYVENAIAQMRQGRQPDPSTTRAIGCSIKRVKTE